MDTVSQWLSDGQNHPDVLIKQRFQDPRPDLLTHQVWGGVGESTSDRFPGGDDAAGSGTTLWETPALDQPRSRASTVPATY